MKVILNIDYLTTWGESLYVSGDIPALGNGNPDNALRMEIKGNRHWFAEINLPKNRSRFSYRYFVKNESKITRSEWGHGHSFFADPATSEVIVYDRWQDIPQDMPVYSSAFVNSICARTASQNPPLLKERELTIQVLAPMVGTNETLALIGAGDSLGNWQENRAIMMNSSLFPEWSVSLPLENLNFSIEFKFVIVDTATGKIKTWECSDNRRIDIDRTGSEAAVVIGGLRFRDSRAGWRGAGVAIPVFSLRSEEDFGVGDFYDLKKMVDWAVKTGQKFIQILPVNDTTMTHRNTDSYPYNANSTFALHPMYLRIEEVGILKDKCRQEYYAALKKEYNQSPTVDYEHVNASKREYIREIYEQEGDETLKSDSFRRFKDKNIHWLKPYAAFCVLRDTFNTPVFGQWGKYAVYNEKDVDDFVRAHSFEINLVYFQQYHLDRQMKHVSNYARSKGVALKGDIPIGISRTSVDAWLSPRLFNLDCQAGAPPDDFSILGQNWGFPTYNWEEMATDGFAWWKARFKKMAEYFDAYRIDHVLGFFRIWEIPVTAIHGLLGHFNPALPYTAAELKDRYNFRIDADLHTTPFINETVVENILGEYGDDVCKKYLKRDGVNRYKFKAKFNTQRKIHEYFATQADTAENCRLRDALMSLHNQVLFIEDSVEKGCYHPRITAQQTYTYRSLNHYEQTCFDRLYNDFFYHRHNDFWRDKALWKLPPLLDSTNMLVCAEDLGMIPHCVPNVMEQLQILSLEIQRMPKEEHTEFGKTWNYPYYSVCTTSTHDMNGIRRWWEEDPQRAQRFYTYVLNEPGDSPREATPEICSRIIDMHLDSPSMLCILPLQDWMALDGRVRRKNPAEELINIPANPRHYWRYRMHLTLEQLLECTNLNTIICEKISRAHR
ncbi:MAG: 4-alpha-glucanotransferase [Muribaculaceae bacterium]|nr:4-alpha-glucanotransferase [Muribaculaceae bacterium]